MHDDFEPISAIVERLVNGLAPGRGEETQPGATALAGTGGTRRAHHDARGGAGVVIWVDFSVRTGAAPIGPYMPPRQSTETVDVLDLASCGVPSVHNDPATGGLGNARKREGR